MTPTTIFLLDPTTLRVSFAYSPAAVAAIKEIGGARWDPASRTWRVPLERLDALLSVFGDSAALAPEVVLAAGAERQEALEPRRPATAEQRIVFFAETCAWAGVALRIQGSRVQGSGGCWTPVLQAAIDARAAGLARLLQSGWQAPQVAAPPPAPVPASMDRITHMDHVMAKGEANALANEERKVQMIERQRRSKWKEQMQKIDQQLGIEGLV